MRMIRLYYYDGANFGDARILSSVTHHRFAALGARLCVGFTKPRRT